MRCDIVTVTPAQNHHRITQGIAWSPHQDTIAISRGTSISIVSVGDLKEYDSVGRLPSDVVALCWTRSGKSLIVGHLDSDVRIWDIANSASHTMFRHNNAHLGLLSLDCSPDGTLVAVGYEHPQQAEICSLATGRLQQRLDCQGPVTSVSFSHDGRVLATRGYRLVLWDTETWDEVSRWDEVSDYSADWSLQFHPTLPLLCSRSRITGEYDDIIRVWETDFQRLLVKAARAAIVRYTSAKVVLVGESNVGKSCLAMRLAEDRYPDDHEHGTTHGMRFWPMEADKLHASAKAPEGQRRDVVLWDFGGQDEYQLVHQMFLQDTTLALVLIDPTRGRAALDEAREWNKRLEKHLGRWPQLSPRENGSPVVKLLVGTKVDKKKGLIDQNSIDSLCRECGFAAFLDLSAKTGRNTQRLRKRISDALDWDQMAKTSRPELFQLIRDDIEARRKKKQIVLTLDAFKKAIKRSAGKLYEEAAVDAVSNQLATQGIIVRTKLTSGDEALVLQLPVIERYAGSLIIAARNNPRGAPVLEERLLGTTKSIPLPGMTKEERLERNEERTVLECVVELMIQHGICFRHGGLLVFPTLFPAGNMEDEKLEHSVSLFYDFTGAIDNIYASLVARLIIGEEFGEGRLWSGRVEFDRPGDGMCGIRQVKRKGGLAHVDLFFGDETPVGRRDLFTGFVEEHLRLNGVEIREHQAIKCRCGKVIEEDDVQANIAAGQTDVICPRCRTKTLISEGVGKIRERDPESDQKILALRKTIDERTAADAASAKKVVARAETLIRSGEPIRILHLSDLHFEKETSPTASLQWLLQDLRADDVNFPAIEKVEYLVLSGDVTHRGDSAGFDKARQFVLKLVEELALDALRCVIVPGNHDIERRDSCYRYQSNVTGLSPQQFVQKGDVYLVRNESDYPNRLKQFSDAFYHKVMSAVDYPLAPEQQGLSYF